MIVWDESFVLGLETIDNQHKILIEIINQLENQSQSIDKKGALNEILKKLVDYTRYHFDFEEKLMQQYHYPDNQPHKIAHEHFTDKIIDYQHAYKKGLDTFIPDMLQFLKEWLSEHIQKTDRRYVEHIQKTIAK